MKFKKRFLMYLAIVGIILAPSMAKAGNAVATNKWMTEIPDSTQMIDTGVDGVTAKFAPVRGNGQSIKRNQKFYMAFYDDGGETHVNQDGTATACVHTGTCVSAPLFIASESALICTDGDVGTATADTGNTIKVSLCADSTCTDATSVVWGADLSETVTAACGVGGSAAGAAQPSIGGQWIYVELTANPGNGEEVLVWVVGQ